MQTFSSVFTQLGRRLYIPRNFETRITGAQGNNNSISNAVGRTLNSLKSTLNLNRNVIPKWIVIVPESDIMSSISYTEFGVSGAYGTLIEHLMKQMSSTTKSLYFGLPTKANKYNWPYFLWIEPTLHVDYMNNALRLKFIRSMYNAAKNFDDKVVILPLKQNCNVQNKAVLTPSRQLNATGLNNFSIALDNTVRFAETKIMRNFNVPLNQIFMKEQAHNEVESRLTRFENLIHSQADGRQRVSMMRQQQERQQYQQVRRFFENRQHNRHPNHHHNRKQPTRQRATS